MGVATQEFIEDRAARDVSEALEQVSNTARGNDSQRLGRTESVYVRGFLVSGGFRGLRYDGLPGADPFGTWPPDAATIERYEVLKGPASVLGGSGSPGGIVNVVSKRPEAVDFAEAEAQLGSFDLYRIAADANGVLPSNSALRGRLIAAFEDGGNFVDGIEERQLTVMPALSAELFDGAGHLRLSGVHQDFDGESFLGIPLLANGEVPDIPPERFVGGDGLDTQFQNDGANFSYDHEFLNNLKLSIKGRYSRSDAISRDIYAYAPVSPNGDVSITSSLRDIDHEGLHRRVVSEQGSRSLRPQA